MRSLHDQAQSKGLSFLVELPCVIQNLPYQLSELTLTSMIRLSNRILLTGTEILQNSRQWMYSVIYIKFIYFL